MRQHLVPRLVEPSLWAQAHWLAVAYVTPTDRPPVLALVFQQRDHGHAIFAGWRHALGEIDVDDLLRIAVIEGAVAHRPPGYSVHIGLDERGARERAGRHGADDVDLESGRGDVWLRVSNPLDSHLMRFKASLMRHGRYLVVPAAFEAELEVLPQLGIGKQRLAFRRVSDVGLVGDPDAGFFGPTTP